MQITQLATLPGTLRIPGNTHHTYLLDSLATSQIHIGEHSEIQIIALLSEGWQEPQKITLHLEGEGAALKFFAIALGHNKESFPFETISEHSARNTSASYYIRSALFDHSSIAYRGNLVIPKKAQLTDSYLSHHTLMLSRNAKTETIPCLEIEADDVKAGHAATIGSLDEELMFYCTSRGISKKYAEEMLIKGFLEADLGEISDDATRHAVQEALIKRFHAAL